MWFLIGFFVGFVLGYVAQRMLRLRGHDTDALIARRYREWFR